MRITETRLTPSRLEFIRPLRTARATYEVREGFLIRLVDEEGRIGQGEAMPLPEFGTESLDTCERVLRVHLERLREQWPRERGKPPLPSGEGRGEGWEFPTVSQSMEALRSDPTNSWAPAAAHAVELALLDLLAQRQRVPLSRLLSPDARTEVQVNALLSADKPEALAEEARRAVAEGFQTLKLKVAGRPLAEDEARVRAVREAVGPAVHLRLDANGGWSEGEAAQALERLGAYNPELCEQPVAADELRGLGRLQQQTRFPLAADEAIASPERFPMLLRTEDGLPAARVFVLKPMVLGGLLPALRFARAAAQIGLESFVTSSLDGVVSRAGAAHLAAALPSGRLASGLAVGRLFVREEPPEHPYQPIQGRIRLPDAPGLGLPT